MVNQADAANRIGGHQDMVLSLRELFCHFYRYPLEQFEQQFLDHCSQHPRLFRLAWRWHRDGFRREIELARQLGDLRSDSDCQRTIEAHWPDSAQGGLVRRGLTAGFSKTAALRLITKLFMNHTLPHLPAMPRAKPPGEAAARPA